MRIDIWSDIACPWCYIGKRHIEDALGRFPHAGDVAVAWRSFQLDPFAPAVPEGDYVTRLSRKYRVPEAEAQAMIDRMTRVAYADGIDMRFDRTRPGNTFDAHRLLHLGARHGVRSEVKERLMQATFTEGAVISDREVLTRLGGEAGLDVDEARAVLASDAYAQDVRADIDQARAYGITAVPFFVFDGRYGVPGAQPADVLLEVMGEVWEAAPAPDPSAPRRPAATETTARSDAPRLLVMPSRRQGRRMTRGVIRAALVGGLPPELFSFQPPPRGPTRAVAAGDTPPRSRPAKGACQHDRGCTGSPPCVRRPPSYDRLVRYESSVTSVSWIPSEAVQGLTALPFDAGLAHYDAPPPDVLTDLEALRAQDGFRFANELRGWIDVEDGQIRAYGSSGQGHIGSTTLRLGERSMTFAAVGLPEIRQEPEVRGTGVRFVQTAGGRTGVPAPRRVRRPPFVQVTAPLAWTTLALTLSADGAATGELAGASPFPRHWVYDGDRRLVAKSGLIDFQTWYREAFGKHSPWGDEDSPALVSAVETALERELAVVIMRGGAKPAIRAVKQGETLVEQGETGDELFLLLDGVLVAEVNGEALAEIGPGAILGERAVLEGGLRTATLRAVTRCRVAAVPGEALDPEALRRISEGHRREEHRRW